MTSVSHPREASGSHISAIHAGSLREQVSRALEAALVTGELQPGGIYSAPGLAERFGVSATPVREAMLDLVKDGFVEVVRNKGFRVREVSESDLDQISQIRHLLEVPTTARAAALLTPSKFELLDMLAAEIEGTAARADVIGYLDADRRFHVALISALGNPRLTELVDRFRRQTRLFGLESLGRSGRLMASAQEHHELLRYLRSGDTAATTRLMDAHIGHTRRTWAAGNAEAQARVRRPAAAD
jgi:DNA-binding GntR family transcriptional regulator